MDARLTFNWLDEADLEPMADPRADDAVNLAAFLDTLKVSEIGRRLLAVSDDGYNVLVGGELFDSYRDHPRRRVWVEMIHDYSTAAGAYQFLAWVWDDLVTRFDLQDFSPASQDAAAVHLIRQCRALQLVHDGRIREALARCRTIWASLPGAGYGQPEHSADELLAVYRAAGGRIAT